MLLVCGDLVFELEGKGVVLDWVLGVCVVFDVGYV